MNAKAQWTQMGTTINGTVNSQQFGYSHALSSDGSIWAIGGAAGTGVARVYIWNGSTWTQRGTDLIGEAAGDNFGSTVSLSTDGLTLAVGAVGNDGAASNAGHIRVFTWDGSTWAQKGADIDGPAVASSNLGESMAISGDGNTVIGGAPYGGAAQGLARVYNWNGSAWVQKGTDIVGSGGNDQVGRAVSISSDGNTMAIGATGESGFGGVTRVYTWNGSAWVIKGSAFTGSGGDNSAWVVRLTPDGNTLAIGTPYNSTTDIGFVSVYTWNGSAWVQKGANITGTANGDNEGRGLAISSDGNTIASGATILSFNTGRVRVFEYNGSAWVQKGSNIVGLANNDLFATFTSAVALSADGSRVASGSGPAAGGGTQRGTARAFAFITPQEINVKGNNVSIVSPDVTPDVADHTSFGTVNIGGTLTRTYTIENTGGATLTISSIVPTGSTTFALGTPLPTTVSIGGSATFSVTYTPTVSGTDNATITITNNDSNEGTYTFDIRGTGSPRNSLNFDRTGGNPSADYVSIPHSTSLNLTTAITLEAWVKTTDIVEQYITTKTGASWYLAVNVSTGKASFYLDGITNLSWLYSTSNVNDGNWHHIVGTYDGTNKKIYIDGVLENTSANTGNFATNSDAVEIGRRSTGFQLFNGSIDEVRIWNVARTCDQINSVMNRELVGNETGLVAYYNFNQGTAGGSNGGVTTLTDLAGTADNGTLTNFALTGATSNWVDGSTNGVTGTTPQIPAEINLTVGASGSTKDVGGYTASTTQDFTYTIQNTGGTNLLLTGATKVSVTGTGFTVLTQPSVAAIAAGGSATFVVRLTLGAAGTSYSALFTIANNDCDENPYTFTLTGRAINATPSGVRGNMMSFNSASSQHINVPDNVALEVTSGSSFTFEAWINGMYGAAAAKTILSKGDGSGDEYIFSIYTNKIALEVQAPAGEWQYSNTDVPTGWNHVAVVFTRIGMVNTATFYLNGKQDGIKTYVGTAQPYSGTASPFYISRQSFSCNCNFFDGNIDEVKIWNTARTQAQIRDNIHLTLAGSESGLLAYYQFNETAGNAIDAVAGNNGALTNSPTRTTSTVSVAKGTSNRQTVNATGNYDFAGTNCSLNFTGTLPAGDIVVNRLEGLPYGTQLGGNTNYSRYYWVINNYGTNSGLTVTPTFVLGSNQITTSDATNLRLHKRVTNNGAGWTLFNGTSATATTGSATFANIDSFSEFGVGGTGSSPLPITLLGLTGERVEANGERTEEVKLAWATASEVSNKGFEIQVSDNAQTFKSISFIEGKGISNTVSSYQLSVSNPSDSYYRLKQIDFDGKFSYSPIVFVEGIETLKVYPNPNNGTFSISVGKGKLDSPARLLNAQGAAVWKGALGTEKTEVKAILPAGLYFLHTTVAGKTKITKIIIEH